MRLPRRQNLLLLGAVILPCALVIALGVRIIRQENELAEKRASEQRQQEVRFAAQELLARLEGIKLRAAGGNVKPGDPEVALVARVDSDRIVLPWEESASRDQEGRLRRLQTPEGAQAFLRTSPLITDEYGVPLAVYAARRLAGEASPELRREIAGRMELVLHHVWLSPAAAHMLAAVFKTVDAGGLRESAITRAAEAEQAEQLARLSFAQESDAVWRLSGKAPWLVGVSGRTGDPHRTLVAIRAAKVLAENKGRWIFDGEPGGQPLGESLPGLRLAIPDAPASEQLASRQGFYVSGLLLVILVIAFTAYLLHRDVRRETQMAALRSQFVSSVSHELKTPVASIRAYAELLDMGRVQDESVRAEYVKTILGESERLSRLVDGVLDFSKIDQGRRVYRLQPVSLEEVLRASAQALEYSLAQGGFDLRIEASNKVPAVAADREALEQAVLNLLTNAMKYSGDDRRIDLSLSVEQNTAVIRVRDHGIGIPLEEQSRIFERFHRAAESEQRNIPGAGLGLALVDHIVKAHGGRVAVESQPGRGSTFSILLPLTL